MSSLYIGGAQCLYASFADEDDWEKFDEQESALNALAKKFNVSVARHEVDYGNHCFIIMHKYYRKNVFYQGAAFKYNMAVEVSDTFEDRAGEFLDALDEDATFSSFHNLEWYSPGVLYFVSS